MAQIKNIPSADEALLFDSYMAQWQTELSLGDWRIERGHKPAKDAMASVEFNDPARLAVYRLGDWKGDPITDDALNATALHEALHILLHDLVTLAQDTRATPDQIEAAEHRVINVLERVLTRE